MQAPTLVLSRTRSDGLSPARDLADRIPGAKYLEMPGFDQVPEAGNMDEVLDAAETFVQSIRAEETVINRALATVLFTDIVESTAKATGLGDAAWKDVVERHHRTVRAMIGRYRGREIDTAGAGFFVTFDGPSRVSSRVEPTELTPPVVDSALNCERVQRRRTTPAQER